MTMPTVFDEQPVAQKIELQSSRSVMPIAIVKFPGPRQYRVHEARAPRLDGLRRPFISRRRRRRMMSTPVERLQRSNERTAAG